MFGYLPPPVFGPSVAYASLLRSEFACHFDVRFINLSVVETIRELEGFRWGKVVKLVKFAAQAFWCLLTRRPALCVYPIAYNRQALLKDSLLLGLVRAFDVPVVLWAHGLGAPRFRESLSSRWRRWFDRNVQSAAAVLVLADCLRAEFAGLIPPARVQAVRIGIEPLPQLPPRTTTPDRLTILYLGALSGTKGIFELLQAMPAVRQRVPQTRLVMAGEWFRAEEEAAAREMTRTHDLNDIVEWPGPVHGLAKWALFRAADVFVFPPGSQLEAYGIVLLEAMQSGVPIVAARGGARNEILVDGVNGLLFTEQDPADLATKLIQLLADPKLREQMGAANQRRFAERYTHKHYGQQMITLLEAIHA